MSAASKPKVLIAPDKFRSTASATELREALGRAAHACGYEPTFCAIADGGEGLLDAFGGTEQFQTVTGPLGDDVRAEWRLLEQSPWGRTAVIEMARASGLSLVGGAARNDPVAASTAGTGELIVAAIDSGVETVIVGCGGSATTDGGEGAIDAAAEAIASSGIRLLVAYDVRTKFLDAPRVFGPQKGASERDIELLTERLATIAERYRRSYGRDVTSLEGSGAAGGLGGGLAAVGGELVPGVKLVAEHCGLDDLIERAQVVITGEGRLDDTSLVGKVVGELIERCRDRRPLLVICGQRGVDLGARNGLSVISLVERFGEPTAFEETIACVEKVACEFLSDSRTKSGPTTRARRSDTPHP